MKLRPWSSPPALLDPLGDLGASRLPAVRIQVGVWCVAALLGSAAVIAWTHGAPIDVGASPALLVVLLGPLYVINDLRPVRVVTPGSREDGVYFTIGSVGAVLVLLVPAGWAIGAIAAGTALSQVLQGREVRKALFNLAVSTAAAVAAIAVAHVGDVVDPATAKGQLSAAATIATFELVSWAGVRVLLARVRCQPLGQSVRGNVGIGVLVAAANTSVGTIIVVLLVEGLPYVVVGLLMVELLHRAMRGLLEADARRGAQLEQQKRTTQLVAGIRDGVLVCSGDGTVRVMSPSVGQLVQLQDGATDHPGRPGAAGRTLDDVLELRDGDGQRVRFADLVAAAEQEQGVDSRQLHLVTAVPPPGMPGRPVRVTTTTTLGERSGGSVVVVVEDRAGHVAAVRDQEELLSHVSHELRTPLTPIVANAQLLARFWDRLDGEDIEQAAAIIADRGKHVLHLVEGLLASAGLAGSGVADPPGAAVAVDEAVADVVADVRLQHPDHHLQVEGECPVRAAVDPHVLRQVVTNLVTNACKYSPAGSQVRIDLDATDQQVVVRVRDEGPGIDTADRARIFGRFQRLGGAAGTPGLGVGLHLARELARQHGGDVQLLDSDRHGSTFQATLPVAAGGGGGARDQR